MLIPFHLMLLKAKAEKYAVGAFNVYNMEGALAVVQAAEELNSPVLLQVLPSAVGIGGSPLIKMCLETAISASVPVAVHLDHCSKEDQIESALGSGISSVMADGSMLDFQSNMAFTRRMVSLAARFNAGVEAELGRIAGVEDGQRLSDLKSKMTSRAEAIEFVEKTDVSALAVCVGNVHGRYIIEPELDFDLLKSIAGALDVPLVLHGTSGLPDTLIVEAMDAGVCKFNVNTEVRSAYVNQLNGLFNKDDNRSSSGSMPELVEIIQSGIIAMKLVVKEKIKTFNSVDKAD